MAERYGWKALLVYSDHGSFDPWLTAQLLLDQTTAISPLVAVQPLYAHPFTVARMVACLTALHGRAVHLNFISGGFPRDLQAFCDSIPHDARYDRVAEYASVIRSLLIDRTPCTHAGEFYDVAGLKSPFAPLEPACAPMFTISGSSSAGLRAARRIGARAIQYLLPSGHYVGTELPEGLEHGARLGIICRTNSAKAWEIAERRYPGNSVAAEFHAYFVSQSDSVWVKELGKEVILQPGHPYWLGPYKHGQAACPFLVGSRDDVAQELAAYIKLGLRTFLLEEPATDEDAAEITAAFARAHEMAGGRA